MLRATNACLQSLPIPHTRNLTTQSHYSMLTRGAICFSSTSLTLIVEMLPFFYYGFLMHYLDGKLSCCKYLIQSIFCSFTSGYHLFREGSTLEEDLHWLSLVCFMVRLLCMLSRGSSSSSSLSKKIAKANYTVCTTCLGSKSSTAWRYQITLLFGADRGRFHGSCDNKRPVGRFVLEALSMPAALLATTHRYTWQFTHSLALSHRLHNLRTFTALGEAPDLGALKAAFWRKPSL